jgi:sugar lactone lactonase YvrE
VNRGGLVLLVTLGVLGCSGRHLSPGPGGLGGGHAGGAGTPGIGGITGTGATPGTAGAAADGGLAGQAAITFQPGLNLLAGGLGGPGNVDGVTTAARFDHPAGVAGDGMGNCYVVDSSQHTVRKIVTATGVVTTIAGTAGQMGATDAIGVAARFNGPYGITADGAGNLYVADTSNRTIRKLVIATGAVTTLAVSAGFQGPSAVVSDGADNLYVVDGVGDDAGTEFSVRKVVVSTGAVTTIAQFSSALPYSKPVNAALDGVGSLYVGDSSRIWKVDLASGATSALASSGGQVTSDGAGSLYLSDTDNGEIEKIVIATGAVTTVASLGNSGGIASDGAGNLCVSTTDGTIRKVLIATGDVSTLAGAPSQPGRADGTGAAARFNAPTGIASDGAGNLYVVDLGNQTVRKVVIATCDVSTFAGAPGQTGAHHDGTGTDARFYDPFGIASDGAGNLYVTDSASQTIRDIKVATAAVTTLVSQPDADATSNWLTGITSEAGGNLYFAAGTAIWKATTATGTITPIAGMTGYYGNEDGTGTGAHFMAPKGIATDGGGNLYVTDTESYTIRKIVVATRAVTTLAGTAGQQGTTDGQGTAALFNHPTGIAFDGAGSLYVADDNTIRKITIATAAVSTVVGVPGCVGVTLGALPASLNGAVALTVLSTGDLAIVDQGENAVLIARF